MTLEATTYGGILGLRALIVIACFALHSAAVDPDELLRAFRRLSFRSALTAALATRMVPVLARDARRFRDAQRCRPGRPASRTGDPARGHRRGARPRGRRRRDARGPRLRRDPAPAAPGAAVVAPRPRLRRRHRRARGARDRDRGGSAGSRSRPTRARWRRSTRACSRWPSRCWPSRCCRSPTAGGSGDERARPRARHLHLPGRCAAGAGRRVPARRAGRVRGAGRRLGVGQVDAAARGGGARAALPRRRVRRAAAGGRARLARPRPGRAVARSPARCSRIPRRRS